MTQEPLEIYLLRKCKIQLQYLSSKYEPTITTTALISELESFLESRDSEVNKEGELTKSLLVQIKDGNHPQFVFNANNNQVKCRCGHNAIWFKTDYVCGTITAYGCRYTRNSISKL